MSIASPGDISGIQERRSLSVRQLLARWEWVLILLIAIVFTINANIAPYFLKVSVLFDMTFNFMEKGLIALVLAFIIITGQIDISVASNMAMSAVITSIFYQMGMDIWAAVFLGLLTGTIGGFVNGFIITKIKLHSMVVTLATQSLFRGIAYVLLGDRAVTGFPVEFMQLGQGYVGISPVPLQLVIFTVLAVICGLALHKTKYGRYLYAIGNNETAARFSGIPVDGIKMVLFTVMGLVSAVAGILFISRVGVCRPDLGEAFLFEIVTIVLLGGVNIYGGEGSIVGVVLSLFLIGLTRYGMILVNIRAPVINIAIGSMLIIAVLVPRLTRLLTREG